METEIEINGVTYIAIDKPLTSPFEGTCKECEIFKARHPHSMAENTICCDAEYIRINRHCCLKLRRKIHRIWKIKSA